MNLDWRVRRSLVLSGALILSLSPVMLAQSPDPGGASTTPDAPAFSLEEIDQLLAPIALYPDSLLSQIFMAATYPIEVVEADRWTRQNEKLKGDALAKALEEKSWDPSVKSLVNFPQVLSMMSEQLD